MADHDKTPWYDRPLASNVVGGLIVAAIVAIVGTSLAAATAAKVPLWAYLVVAATAALILSFIIPVWRRAVWVITPKAIWQGIAWLFALRPISAAGRDKLMDQGRESAMDEVAEARRRAGKPSFHVRQDDSPGLGIQHRHWLTNRGKPVSDIHVTASNYFFHIDGEIRVHGTLGTNNMAPFEGEATDRGSREGVSFHATWVDENGDSDEGDFFFPPEDVQQYRDKALNYERQKGIIEGRQLERRELAARTRTKSGKNEGIDPEA